MPHPVLRRLFLVCLVSLAAALAVPAAAQVTFTRIADDTTPVPGTAETFDFFGEAPPVLDAGSVAFEGDYGAGEAGVFRWDAGVVSTVARTGTPLPPAGSFERAYTPTIDGTTVGFGGVVGGKRGIFLSLGGSIGEVVEEGDPVPGKVGETFDGLSSPSVDDGELVFHGTDSSSSDDGIYRFDGDDLSVVADTSTPVPGGGGEVFQFLYGPFVDAGEVTFAGVGDAADPVSGVFLSAGGSLSIVARDGDVASGGSVLESFTSTDTSSDSGWVAFRATTADFSQAIYLPPTSGGGITTVAHQGDPRPGGGVFGSLSGSPATSQGRVVFDEDGNALWLWQAGELTPLVEAGDLLDGDVVTEVYVSPEGLDGDQLTFVAYFEDDTAAIYLAELPPAPVSIVEVPTLGGVGSALLVLLLAGLGAGFLWLRPSLG